MPWWGWEAQFAEGFLENAATFVKESDRRDAGMTGRGEEASATEKTREQKHWVCPVGRDHGSYSMGLALCLLVTGNMLVTCDFFFF